MKVLLDTHIWSGNLRRPLSAMSLWDAQMLHSKGRLSVDRPLAVWLPQAAAADVVVLLPLDVEVVLALDHLPQSFHGDPADRMIVATALTHGLPLATQDSAIQGSGVVPLWKGSA